MSDRRVELLQKQNIGGLTASERLELEELNAKADQEIHKILGPINERLSELAQHNNELQTLELCSCGKAPECLPGRHFRQVACRRCGRRGPLAETEWLAIKLWNNDHPRSDDLTDRVLQILGNPGITETTYAKLKVVLAGKAYTAPLDDYVTLLERNNGRLREVLKEALEQSGCDGDLCNYRWHEKARVLLGE